MPDIQPLKKDDSNNEPLIPMPSVTPPSVPSEPVQADPPQTPAPQSSTEQKVEVKSQSAAPAPVVTPAAPDSPVGVTSVASSVLEDIKRKALTELKPLLDEVDLPAEQKFHTILEIISMTNDSELIPKLYESAEAIEDKHERAQALLDVVSEIEYLSKGKDKDSSAT